MTATEEQPTQKIIVNQKTICSYIDYDKHPWISVGITLEYQKWGLVLIIDLWNYSIYIGGRKWK